MFKMPEKLPINYKMIDDVTIEVTYPSLREFSETLYAEFSNVQEVYKNHEESVGIKFQFSPRNHYSIVNGKKYEDKFKNEKYDNEKYQMQIDLDSKNEKLKELEDLIEARTFPFEEEIYGWKKQITYLVLEPFVNLKGGDGAVIARYASGRNRMWFSTTFDNRTYAYSINGSGGEEDFKTLEEAYENFKMKERARRLERLF
jgi:hypothetical protein